MVEAGAGTKIQGNFVGTSISGLEAIGNASSTASAGVLISSGFQLVDGKIAVVTVLTHQGGGWRSSTFPVAATDPQKVGAAGTYGLRLNLQQLLALAAQDDDKEMKARFTPIAKQLETAEAKIVDELIAAQGEGADLGGYFRPDDAKATKVMRPSATFNMIVDAM